MIWAVYLLFLAGGYAGCSDAVRTQIATYRAGKPKPGSHEDLP